MLAIIFFYTSITLTCLWTGYFVQLFFQGFFPIEKTVNKHGVVVALWGLMTITLAAQIAELFVPLNQYAWMVWMLMLTIGSLIRKKTFLHFTGWLSNTIRRNIHLAIPCCIILLFVSNLGAGPLIMDDTDSYHIQMIKWIQEYGTVPGLANLHERYGFNSSWFSIAAFFIPTRTSYNFFSMANGLLSVWMSVYLFSRSFPGSEKDRSFTPLRFSCFVLMTTALFCWPMIRGNAASANYDFITTCTLVVLLVELSTQRVTQQWKQFLPELILWPVFLFTVRIVNAPVLLISLFGLVQILRSRMVSFLAWSMLLSSSFVLPFLIRNLILSGFVLFPAYQIDLFVVDWKAEPNITRQLVDYIKYFNRVNNAFMPLDETRRIGFPEWIPVWFHYLFGYDKPLLVAGLSGYALTIIRPSFFRRLATPAKLFVWVMPVQLLLWFFIAPDPRFVYGPLLIGVFLLFSVLPGNLVARYFVMASKALAIILLSTMLAYTILKAVRSPDYRRIMMPVRIPEPATRLVVVDGIKIRIPEKILGNWNPRCYATELPCLYQIQPGLKARGTTIGDGFKIEK